MTENIHKPSLYRWKRQEDPRSYSRSQKVATNSDIQNWIQKVEDASHRAAEQVFGSSQHGRTRGKAIAKATREYMQDDEQAYNEAQDLLSQWMEEKVNLTGGLGPEIDCNYDEDGWEKHEIQADVKREWDNLLANNYEEYGLPLSSRLNNSHSKDIYNFDEGDVLASVMKSMLDKQVVKKEFKNDLGLDKWGKHKDPRNKMELRHQQVKENREKREMELRKKHEEKQNRKEVQAMAKRLVIKEERDKQLQMKREEAEIRKEMSKIRKQMQDDRQRMNEQKLREQQAKEETLFAAKIKVATDIEAEKQESIEGEKRYEEQQRFLAQRMRELEAKEAANNLRCLHRHFSAWYNLVLDRRLKMGKARAMYDWKLMLRGWNAWRSFIRVRNMDRESKQQEQDVINIQRNQQIADRHSRQTVLRKYFIAWQVWVHSEQDRRYLENAQNNTRNKMMSLLEAAATGKLSKQEDSLTHKSTPHKKETHRKSTADKINALFENTRKLPQNTSDSLSTDRSDVTTPVLPGNQHKHSNSRLPTEPWQVTRRHIDLTAAEMADLGGGEPSCSPEEMNAKILKKYGRQPWHKKEISTYEHRHATQKKILEEQKKQILEQQRLIEELQFKSTHAELQKQLAEQKLVLQQMSQQMADTEHNIAETEQHVKEKSLHASKDKENRDLVGKSTPKSRPKSAVVVNSKKTISSNQRPQSVTQSCAKDQKSHNDPTPDTSHIGASTNRSAASTARTDVSRPSSFTSTASEKSKYLQVLKNMDDRAAERTRLKKEREEKRRKAEEERLFQLEAEAEARRLEEEEEKKTKALAYKERKRLEKQREVERLLLEEKLRQQTEMANKHFEKSLLKYRGIIPMKKLVAMARQQEEKAKQHFEKSLQRKVLLGWHHYVQEEWKEKGLLAEKMSNYLAVKHCFQNWKLYKHHMIIEEHKAKMHYEMNTKHKIFQAWRDYANEEKVASWEKERRAREHFRRLLLKRYLHAWRTLPEEIEKEKLRERRRAELRQKVASILPDFEPSVSVDASTDFHK